MTTAIARADATCTFCGTTKDVEAHHFREDNPQMGKGMGGAYADLDTIDLCHEHHQGNGMGLHKKRWVLTIENGIARGFEPGAIDGFVKWQLFERPLVLDNENPAPEFWDEQKLAQAYVGADMALMLWKGQMASVFHARKQYRGDWPELAAAAITRHTGEQENVSGRTVRRWEAVYTTTRDNFQGDPAWMDNMGRAVVYLLCESKDGPMSKYEEARECQDKGMSQKATIRQLTGRTVVNERERCTCACGDVHYRKEAD